MCVIFAQIVGSVNVFFTMNACDTNNQPNNLVFVQGSSKIYSQKAVDRGPWCRALQSAAESTVLLQPQSWGPCTPS